MKEQSAYGQSRQQASSRVPGRRGDREPVLYLRYALFCTHDASNDVRIQVSILSQQNFRESIADDPIAGRKGETSDLQVRQFQRKTTKHLNQVRTAGGFCGTLRWQEYWEQLVQRPILVSLPKRAILTTEHSQAAQRGVPTRVRRRHNFYASHNSRRTSRSRQTGKNRSRASQTRKSTAESSTGWAFPRLFRDFDSRRNASGDSIFRRPMPSRSGRDHQDAALSLCNL